MGLRGLLLQSVSAHLYLHGVIDVLPGLQLAAAVFPFVWGLRPAGSVLVLDAVPARAPGDIPPLQRSLCRRRPAGSRRTGVFLRRTIFRADIGIYERVNG